MEMKPLHVETDTSRIGLFRTIDMILEIVGNAKKCARNGQEMKKTKCVLIKNDQNLFRTIDLILEMMRNTE